MDGASGGCHSDVVEEKVNSRQAGDGASGATAEADAIRAVKWPSPCSFEAGTRNKIYGMMKTQHTHQHHM